MDVHKFMVKPCLTLILIIMLPSLKNYRWMNSNKGEGTSAVYPLAAMHVFQREEKIAISLSISVVQSEN